ncbi:MAG: hypothetical protein HY321_12810 [Armatimonadetes bacterium]|nr:hypothetical protein [Armatimonadota bacterium]
MRYCLLLLVLASSLGLTILLAGCSGWLGSVDGTGLGGAPGGDGQGGGVSGDREPPAISNVAASPVSVRFTGGTVALSAEVTDAGGVAAVWADVTAPDGASTSQPMSPAFGAAYAGEWTAPPNTGESGAPLTFTLLVRARDQAGNTSAAEAVTITVQAPGLPPAGPPPLQ